jgi:hypothetical protein
MSTTIEGDVMKIDEIFTLARSYQYGIAPSQRSKDAAQKFLSAHEGEDSQEMIAQDLAYEFDVIFQAGKILAVDPERASGSGQD